MTFIRKSEDEIRAMSEEDFRTYLRAAAAEDGRPGGVFDQMKAKMKANPPKAPKGPVKAIVMFPPRRSIHSNHDGQQLNPGR